MRIGDDVEIGANTTIDRGALEDTVIEEGVKLDNQIQIGHNVRIGAHTVIAAVTAIAGSTEIGAHCMVGGGVCINGHIKIVNGVHLAATTVVHKCITQPGAYSSGTPMQPFKEAFKSRFRFKQLDKMAKRLRALERKIDGG